MIDAIIRLKYFETLRACNSSLDKLSVSSFLFYCLKFHEITCNFTHFIIVHIVHCVHGNVQLRRILNNCKNKQVKNLFLSFCICRGYFKFAANFLTMTQFHLNFNFLIVSIILLVPVLLNKRFKLGFKLN